MDERPSAPRRGRRKSTRRTVRVIDRTAAATIVVGGLGTILAVVAVFVFLLWVVKDLFVPASTGEPRQLPAASPAASAAAQVVDLGIDEYRTFGWSLDTAGVVRGIRADDGSVVREIRVTADGGPAPSAAARDADGRSLVLGYADGSVRLCEIGFATGHLEDDAVPAELRGLPPGGIGRLGDALAERMLRGSFRLQELTVALSEPVVVRDGVPIVGVHRSTRGGEVVVAAVDAAGGVALRTLTREEDLFGGPATERWGPQHEVPVATRAGRGPVFVLLTDLAANLVVGWRDGGIERWSVRQRSDPTLAERLDLAPEPGTELTALGLLLGGVTLIAGTSDGKVGGWFVAPAEEGDGYALVRAHLLDLGEVGAITAVAASTRERVFAVGTSTGAVVAAYMTSGKLLAELAAAGGGPVAAVGIAPKTDGLLAATAQGITTWTFDAGHPETTFRSLFGRVWYERYPEPSFVWQSSSGTDDFEPKLSLVPLVFGTIKATLYSMLIGVPLALLAAIYTSEFLSRGAKARIKPLVEMMASLPSVVLGFLAAIVIAPAVETAVPAILTAFVTVPLSLLVAAHVWQALPQGLTVRHAHLRLAGSAAAMALGVVTAFVLAPSVEARLFGGDVRLWFDGQVGSGITAWVILLVAPVALAMALGLARWVDPRLHARLHARPVGASRGRAGLVHLGRLLAGVVACAVAVWLVATVLYHLPTWFGRPPFDLRAGLPVGGLDLSPFGTWDQRNALVVGFVMGFAIVPIVYTLAEDALSSVPDHLRAASLGAGATPWQTTVRVVVPTAASGLFAAAMIGLGRAVGETMIVLMAAGNTPVLDLNLASGFRTLSANLATELPEAVRDSTHYRTLFLAALVLFAMTFVINTIAERVRQRFRRRAFQL